MRSTDTTSFQTRGLLSGPPCRCTCTEKFKKSEFREQVRSSSLSVVSNTQIPKINKYIWLSAIVLKFTQISVALLSLYFVRMRVLRRCICADRAHCLDGRGLSRLSDQGKGMVAVLGAGNRPNQFCECAIVGLRTSLHSTLLFTTLI